MGSEWLRHPVCSVQQWLCWGPALIHDLIAPAWPGLPRRPWATRAASCRCSTTWWATPASSRSRWGRGQQQPEKVWILNRTLGGDKSVARTVRWLCFSPPAAAGRHLGGCRGAALGRRHLRRRRWRQWRQPGGVGARHGHRHPRQQARRHLRPLCPGWCVCVGGGASGWVGGLEGVGGQSATRHPVLLLQCPSYLTTLSPPPVPHRST